MASYVTPGSRGFSGLAYDGNAGLVMSAYDVGEVRFLAIDNSDYQITAEQLEFYRDQVKTGKPLVLAGLSVVESTDHAVVRLLTSHGDLARRLLERHQFLLRSADNLIHSAGFELVQCGNACRFTGSLAVPNSMS